MPMNNLIRNHVHQISCHSYVPFIFSAHNFRAKIRLKSFITMDKENVMQGF